MSAKSQFLKKLQTRHTVPSAFKSQSEADVAAFRYQMEQLLEQMSDWVADTGLQAETANASVSDLLVEGGTFSISAILVRHEERTIKFTPLFLYGHGVTGCVEITLHTSGKARPLGRLFMRTGNTKGWSSILDSDPSRSTCIFDEETFFNVIENLLP
ncbi:hypothetical protein [Enterobacter sp. Bisph1]|uniref:hypothetical protein n=1 Tax=Enterobacter sp. Bisph1 TaxID=1274399 RepID=UPI00057C02F7|nr:hypothetical protein [Enterobacter sp. Bisph1]